MTEIQLKRLNELDYLIRHAKKDRDYIIEIKSVRYAYGTASSEDIQAQFIKDGKRFDYDVWQEALEKQLMRTIIKLGECEKEFNAS